MALPMSHVHPASKSLLLFGPGALSLDLEYFNRILEANKAQSTNQWALHAIQDIESCWGSICKAIPKLQQTPGASHARYLAEWLDTGTITPSSTVANLPNSILGPIVILAQLVEYLEHTDHKDGKGFKVPSTLDTETIGCCLGVFSALVVSLSASWAQFIHNAGAVLRAVFVLGALSDAHDASDATGPSVSLMAFWKGGQSLSDLNKVLESYPESYVSVLYDDNRATITASSRSVSTLKDHLRRVGFTVNDTEFHGRFHAGQLYEPDIQALFDFCRHLPTFQLPFASSLSLPTRINRETTISDCENLLEAATRAFLVEQFSWIKTLRSAVSSSLQGRNCRVIEFGPERCVPPTLLRRLKNQITHVDLEGTERNPNKHLGPSSGPNPKKEDDIAVIGMSCKVAGAQDLEEYWKILMEGRSQHKELIPNDRFAMETTYRPYQKGDDQKRWYANVIDDHDAFDYRFFKKSPREALHMDPQQRLILQVAYQAVAQSGYYHKLPSSNDRIGCYMGVVGSDYENNISHTTPNAFSATGALRCYISGKVSHYFGWTGPAMTLDTACSASTVAISLACQAILSGDCSAALAGGTNLCNGPLFFQNLAAGSFLSATGQCKPFDKAADGYCRGEAIGAVFLKKLSNAVADGDQILGVISATAVNQNQNTTPIFVPNPLSLTDLFQNVISKSGLDVKDISVVEAHGTGTAVGDPAEYNSIRRVLGVSSRSGLKPLQLGSVKGLIGHTEGASGVVSLIKILLMMHEGRIPPQASFNAINPAIKASPSDNINITVTPIPWKDEFKAAVINNFGAAGSNASMVIKQAPKQVLEPNGALSSPASSLKFPVYISAIDDKGIRAYTTRLRQYLKDKIISGDHFGIENLAFNLNRQSNWSLGRALIFATNSVDNLDQQLSSFVTLATPIARPVIMCFGGQVANFVGLDREVFDKATALRHYLDQCNSICKLICGREIYPEIFQKEPIIDPSVLQPLLFAMQYSCAMSWIDCGVQPAALVGHSFGELTALCVSGTLSLEDAVKLVYGRSKIIKDSWGPEKGSMMAIEADLEDVENLLAASNVRLGKNTSDHMASIACFNGPRSFTLAGSEAAINAVQHVISTHDTAIRYKRLNVSNAFHSTLVDSLKTDLEALGHTMVFAQSKIPLERSTEEHETRPFSAAYVAEHMRQPVYFNHAVQRLATQFPQAIWLEAGSNSTITTMANKALGMPESSVFQAINVTSSTSALQQLSNATMSLWKAGLRAQFWPHSRKQTYQYAPIILPPYQFEKSRHWLEFKTPLENLVSDELSPDKTDSFEVKPLSTHLHTPLDPGDDDKERYRFRINTQMEEFIDVVSGQLSSLKDLMESSTRAFSLEPLVEPVKALPQNLNVTDNISARPKGENQIQPAVKPAVSRSNNSTDKDLWIQLQRVLADISGLELDEIQKTDSLADIGIDSLMGMEMAHDIEKNFHCTLEQSEIVAIVDVEGVLSYLKLVLGLTNGEASVETSNTASSNPSSGRETRYPSPISSVEDVEFPETYDHSNAPHYLPPSSILDVFRESTACTDDLLKSHGCAHYLDGVSLKQTRLCLKLISRAFKQLGCDIETAHPGEILQPISSISKHRRFHDHLYKILEDTRVIDINGGIITRTAIPLPAQSAEAILEELMRHHGQHGSLHQLTYNIGTNLAEVLSGNANGPQLLFGDAKNRELMADFYGEYPFNKVYFELMANFLTRLAAKMKHSPENQTTLKILEMGAGTGGATKTLIPALVKLGVPVEYTFTDLSPSLVAQAKKKFKRYPFMKFLVHDIEKPPSQPELIGSQHIVIASNAVHATHSLRVSSQNIRKFLRQDGFLLLVEMMDTLHCIDLVWGTLEDWWLFDDDRTHAIVDQLQWERELLSAGYKHVEWTHGDLPESRSERILIALASDAGQVLDRPLATTESHAGEHGLYLSTEELKARRLAADEYVRITTRGFSIPDNAGHPIHPSKSTCVLVTGATGSLGSHIVQHLLSLPSVDLVCCLNRPSVRKGSPRDPLKRQIQAMESKGIFVDETMVAKLQAIETDTSSPRLGLSDDMYDRLSIEVTHIVHNAYPSNGLRTLSQNENQFVILRNLVDFGADVVSRRKNFADSTASDFKFTFQFVSSMAAVGVYPTTHGNGETAVPEQLWDVESALPNGYGGSKAVCERILRDTLGRYPDHFRAMSVRLGQLSGSKITGYWNHMEVLGFLFKSSQTLASFPVLDGVLTWLTLEDTSASLGDLLLRSSLDCYPIYHLDSPVHRTWADVTPVMTEALGVPQKGIVPLEEWIRRVRAYPGEDPWDNPAAKAMDFFEHKFEHMSCGGVTLATDKTREHSETLRAVQPVTDSMLKKYVQGWKASGFLR